MPDTAAPDTAALVASLQSLLATYDPAASAPDLTALAAGLKSLFAAFEAALPVASALPADQQAMAKSLSGPALLAFLKAPAAERIAKSTPIHKSADGTLYFAHDDARLVAMAKSADATAVELAKSRADAEAVGFEKSAQATIPNLAGTMPVKAAIMKSIAGIADEPTRTAVALVLKGADAAMKMLGQAPGVGNVGEPVEGSPQAQLDAIAAGIAKTGNVTFAKAMDQALSTPAGRQLYDAIEAAKRAPRAN